MNKRNRFGKRMIPYVLAAAFAVSAGFAGTGITSQAASYIQYDNIIIRDDANGNVLGGIDKGTEVEILESKTGSDGKTWNHVRYASNGGSAEGWVRSDLMTEDRSKVETDEDQEADNAGQNHDQPDTDQPDTDQPDENEPEDDTDDGTVDDDGANQSADVSAISGDGYQPNGDHSFDVQGKTLTISDDYDSDVIPADFESTKITYNGSEISALKYKNGDVFLLYLTDDDGNGDFYVLDTQQNCVASFIRLGSDDNSLILLLPPTDSLISSSYGKTIFAVDETRGITAYQYNQDAETMKVDIVLGEYYYVYGISQNGTLGWFLYDNGTNTFVRSTTDLSVDLGAAEDEKEAGVSENNSLDKMMIVGLAALCVLFLVLAIIFGVRSRSARKYIPEEEYEDEDEEEIMTRAERRREERRYRRFMEDYEDDDYEDDLEEDETPSEPAVTEERAVMPQTEGSREAVEEAEEQAEAGDYDVEVSDTADYDLTDDNTPEDDNEYDDLEKMLVAGLEDAMNMKSDKEQNLSDTKDLSRTQQISKAIAEKRASEEREAQPEPVQPIQDGEDDWDDELEFLDL